jgi:hypothetical protein
MWLDRLPASVAFCDVETTGLGKHDRIVSFGGIGVISRDLAKGRPDLAYLYLVFDPGMGNHGAAEQIHGFSDSALRLQDPFAVHAADVRRFLTSYELRVMNGPKATSALSPFDSQLRTLVGEARRSHSCQERTLAGSYSITSSAATSPVQTLSVVGLANRPAPCRSVARLKVAIYIIAAGIGDKFHSSPARGSVTGQARGT